MPQIDFGRAFQEVEVTPSVGRPRDDEFVPANEEPATAFVPAPTSNARIGRSGLTHAVFVAVMVLGGLFCAFYFFNGAELIRAAASWPAELLYSRPAEPAPAKIDNQPSAPAAPPVEADANASEQGPFRRSAQSLLNADTPPQFAAPPLTTNPNTFASAPTTPPLGSGANALLDQLGGTAPGGDSLSRTLNEQAAMLQQTATSAVNDVGAKAPQTISQPPLPLTRKTIRSTKTPSTHRTGTAQNSAPVRAQTNKTPASTNAQLGLDKRGIGPGMPGGLGPGVLGGVGGGTGGGASAAGGIGHGGGIGGGAGIGGLGGLPGGLIGGRH
jgi:hypothetical protein